MAQSIARNDRITVNTECGIGVGHVHTVVSADRVFVQVRVGTTLLNKYLALADENKTWIREHDVDKLKAVMAAEPK